MTREQRAIIYLESKKKRLEDFRKIYPSPDTVGYQATTQEISFYDMAISALSESDNVGMSMNHRAIAKVIDDYIANNKGNVIKQYTAYEIKTLLISDDSDNKGEWIPVSERLPKESGRYLTYIVNEYDEKLQYIMTADYIARPTPIEGLSPWNVDDECASDNVVAWQPLPEPYQKGGE